MGGLVDKGRVTEQHLGVRQRGCVNGWQDQQAACKEELKNNEAIISTKFSTLSFSNKDIAFFLFSFDTYYSKVREVRVN